MIHNIPKCVVLNTGKTHNIHEHIGSSTKIHYITYNTIYYHENINRRGSNFQQKIPYISKIKISI